MTEAQITPVPQCLLGEAWPECAPHLFKGLAKATDLTIKQVVDDLLAGTDQLWCVIVEDRVVAAFITATFLDEERGDTFLGVFALGGTQLSAWGRQIGERMVEAAKSAGCGSVRFTGRDAWSRVLPAYQVIGRRGHEAIYERAVR